MSLITGPAMFLVIWWIVLFMVLPIGTRPVAEADPLTGWRGAPENPQLLRKAIITTLVSVVVWLACYVLITSGWINFRTGWLAIPD